VFSLHHPTGQGHQAQNPLGRDATRAELGFSGSSIGFPMGLSLTPLAHVSASPQVLPFAAGRKMFPQRRRQPLTNSPEAYALFLFSIAFFP